MEKLSKEGLTSENDLLKEKSNFKNFLEKNLYRLKAISQNSNGLTEHGLDSNQVLEKIKRLAE